MDNHPKRMRHNKPPKNSRRPRPGILRPIKSGEIASQFPPHPDSLNARSSGSGDVDRLNDIIDDITSEGDDARAASTSRYSGKSTSAIVEPPSPEVNDNHASFYTLPSSSDFYRDRTSSGSTRSARPKKTPLKDRKSQFSDKGNYSPSRASNFDDRTDTCVRRKSIGDVRRQELTEFMEHYRHCLESAQHSNAPGMIDDPSKNEKRKEYTTALW